MTMFSRKQKVFQLGIYNELHMHWKLKYNYHMCIVLKFMNGLYNIYAKDFRQFIIASFLNVFIS